MAINEKGDHEFETNKGGVYRRVMMDEIEERYDIFIASKIEIY